MENASFRTTIVIRFSYHTAHNNNTAQTNMVESMTNSTTRNAARSSCAVCGSQLHMTSKVL